MENQLLNLQADKIEMVLAAHKASARVWGGRLTPRTVQFHLAPAAETKIAKLETLTEGIALFDPKAHSFDAFAHAAHLLFPIVREPAETLARIRRLVAEMERRETERSTRPQIVVVLDELADLLQTCGSELEAQIARLVQRGRSAGFSVIACTQKPAARIVGSLVKANFPVRLVGRVASADDARVAAGIGGTGAEKLAGRGDFLLVASGQVIRFQAAHLGAQSVALPTQAEADAPGFRARMMANLRRVK